MNFRYLKYIFFLLFLLFFLHSNAQLKEIFSGVVLNLSDSTPISSVHVINKTTNYGVVSKENGSFIIAAKKNDTLVVSSIGYLPYKHIVKNSYFIILLKKATYELESFNVLPYKDYESFKEAFINLRVEDPAAINQSIYLSKEEMMAYYYSANQGIIISGAISSLIGMFNKYMIDKKKYLELLEKDKKEEKINERFSPAIIQKITSIETKEEAIDFINYCEFSVCFILNASEFELHKKIHERFDAYKNAKNSTK